jgi:hypothetical protein
MAAVVSLGQEPEDHPDGRPYRRSQIRRRLVEQYSRPLRLRNLRRLAARIVSTSEVLDVELAQARSEYLAWVLTDPGASVYIKESREAADEALAAAGAETLVLLLGSLVAYGFALLETALRECVGQLRQCVARPRRVVYVARRLSGGSPCLTRRTTCTSTGPQKRVGSGILRFGTTALLFLGRYAPCPSNVQRSYRWLVRYGAGAHLTGGTMSV